MPNDSHIVPRSHSFAKKKKSLEQLLHPKHNFSRPTVAAIAGTNEDENLKRNDNHDKKKRKFRWSTCLSRLSNKFSKMRSSTSSVAANTNASNPTSATHTAQYCQAYQSQIRNMQSITEDTLHSNLQQQPASQRRPLSSPLITSSMVHSRQTESKEIYPDRKAGFCKQYKDLSTRETNEREPHQPSAAPTPQLSSLSPPPRQNNRVQRESCYNNHNDTRKTDISLNEIFSSNNTQQRQMSSKASTALSTCNSTNKSLLTDPTLTPRVRPTTTTAATDIPRINAATTKRASLLRLSLESPLAFDDTDAQSSRLSSSSSTMSNVSFFTPATASIATHTPYRSGTLGLIAPSSSERTTSITAEATMASMVMPPLPPPPFPSSNSTSRPHSQSSVRTQFSSTFVVDTPKSMTIADEPLEQEGVHTNNTYTQSPSSTTTTTGIGQLRPLHEIKSIKERRRKRSPLSMPDTEQLTLAMEKLMVRNRQSQAYEKNTNNSRDELEQSSRTAEIYTRNKRYHSDITCYTDVVAAATGGLDGNSYSIMDVDYLLGAKHMASSLSLRSERRHSFLTTTSIKSTHWIDNGSGQNCNDCNEDKRISFTTTTDNIYATMPVCIHQPALTDTTLHGSTTSSSPPPPSPPLETPPFHRETAPSLISALSTPNSLNFLNEEEHESRHPLLSAAHLSYHHHRLLVSTSTATADIINSPVSQD